MNPIVKNILAVVAGIAIATLVNGGIVGLSGNLIPPPEGVVPGDMESIAQNIDNFKLQHWLLPFFAHALGTLAGAFTTAKLAATHKKELSLGIGALFLIAGVYMCTVIPAPTWFMATDLIIAYLPMGWLGYILAGGNKNL